MGVTLLRDNTLRKDIILTNSVINKNKVYSILYIVGDEYNFTELDKRELSNNFDKLIFIPSISINTLIQFDISSNILILFNNNELFSRNLKEALEKKNINHMKIQEFMDIYLLKNYIGNDILSTKASIDIESLSLLNSLLKKFIDYIVVIILGILSSPFIFYSIYRIRKESPGPVFFKQKRVGLNGKEFECIKLRSMNLDAEKNGAQFATENDSRIFAWGKTMRSTRIDELPQLWNILKGDMHLIGPRPERKVWIDQFEKEIPHYNERHRIKPGVTGWAQVLYPYGADKEDAKQKLMYDLYYIKHWNLWLEIKIIWKTVMVVLMKKGV
jgi:lipopolysaccharide/colanic/teichoic acid biosynthesis glycosyltransferase